MASLLDFPQAVPQMFGGLYSDPSSAGTIGTAAGLLQAGGPQRFPVSLGQAMGQGLLSGFNLYQEAEQARRRSQLLDAQSTHLSTQDKVLNEQMTQAQRVRDEFARMAGGGGLAFSPVQAATAMGGEAGDVGPTPGNLQRLAAIQEAQANAPEPPPDVNRLGALGFGPEQINTIIKGYELRNPNLSYQGGVGVHPRTGQPQPGAFRAPQKIEGVMGVADPSGAMQEVPGSAQLYGQTEAIKQREAARYGAPISVQSPGGGPARMMTPLQLSEFLGGTAPTQPGTPRPAAGGGAGGGPGVSVPSESQSAFGKELGQRQATALLEGQKAAEDSVQIINTVREGRKILDSGVITGFGADFKTGMGMALQQVGIDYGGDAPANTQAFASNMANNVGRVIKQFGSGTGLSDADREYASKIAGGSVNLDERAIRRIFEIQEKQARWVIRNHNAKAKGINSQVPLTVQEPSEWSMRPAPRR